MHSDSYQVHCPFENTFQEKFRQQRLACYLSLSYIFKSIEVILKLVTILSCSLISIITALKM